MVGFGEFISADKLEGWIMILDASDRGFPLRNHRPLVGGPRLFDTRVIGHSRRLERVTRTDETIQNTRIKENIKLPSEKAIILKMRG